MSTMTTVSTWLDRVDPGTHRRIKGLRLVTAYGMAAMMGYLPILTRHAPGATLSALAGAFTLIVTLELSGDTAMATLAARAWETLIGGALGLAAALLILPILSGQTNTPAMPPAG